MNTMPITKSKFNLEDWKGEFEDWFLRCFDCTGSPRSESWKKIKEWMDRIIDSATETERQRWIEHGYELQTAKPLLKTIDQHEADCANNRYASTPGDPTGVACPRCQHELLYFKARPRDDQGKAITFCRNCSIQIGIS